MKKRILFGFLCGTLLFILMISTDSDFVQRVSPFTTSDFDDSDITCYDKKNVISGVPNFHPESELDWPKDGKNIFFHETSCFGEEGIMLNARQACAIESAAMMNPGTSVYLLLISQSRISNGSQEIVKRLLSYPNVKIRHIDPEKYMKDTPLERWYASGMFKKSHWPRSHMSDVLRYLTLWKFGGIYLDLDVVVITSLEGLTDFAGAEDWDHVAAGVMGFGMTPLGRRIADACLRDLQKNFRGDIWGNNGPGVITRTLQKICSNTYTRDMSPARCHGFRVYPPSTFYPIHYEKWKKYFETTDLKETMKLLNKSMAIHVWNKLSKGEQVHVDSEVPYTIIARKYCPKTISSCTKLF